MTDFSCASADSGAISDLEQLYDEDDDLDSSASSVAGAEELPAQSPGAPDQEAAVSQDDQQNRCPSPATSLPTNGVGKEGEGLSGSSKGRGCKERRKTRSLNILDLPVDLLQDIIKEVCILSWPWITFTDCSLDRSLIRTT